MPSTRSATPGPPAAPATSWTPGPRTPRRSPARSASATTPARSGPSCPSPTRRALCRLLPGGTEQPCDSGTFAPALPGDGTYAVAVTLTDAAGNTSQPGTSGSYVYDGTPPGAATVTGPQGPGRVAAVGWSVEGEGTARCRLLLAGTPGAWEPCTGGFSTVLDPDGSWVLEVELTDEAGNTSTVLSEAYLLDRVAPGAPAVAGPRGPSRQPQVTWTVSTEPGTRVECQVTGPQASGWQACGPVVDRSLDLDGSYVLEARLVDEAGNTGPVGRSAGYVLDRTAPFAPAVGGPTGPSTGRTPSWVFELGDAATAECALRRDGVVVQDWHSCTSPAVRDLAGGADGRYTLSVRLTDLAGNTGPAGTSPSYVLDTTAPSAPVVTGPTGPTRVTAPVVTFTGEAGTTATCRVVRADAPRRLLLGRAPRRGRRRCRATGPGPPRCASPTPPATPARPAAAPAGSWTPPRPRARRCPRPRAPVATPSRPGRSWPRRAPR